MIIEGLREFYVPPYVQILMYFIGEVTGRDDIAMNYQQYATAIVARYKVHLVGWPANVPFNSPSNISTVHLQRLQDALQSHECMWHVMSRQELDLHNAELDVALATGEITKVPRKERSHKSKKRRSKQVVDDENDNEDHPQLSPTKKKRRTAAPKNKEKKSKCPARKTGVSKAVKQMPPLPISPELVPSDADSDSE